MFNPKCKLFELASMNSDANCFVPSNTEQLFIDNNDKSMKKVIDNPKICENCPYNIRFINYSYSQFERFNKIYKIKNK